MTIKEKWKRWEEGEESKEEKHLPLVRLHWSSPVGKWLKLACIYEHMF